MEADTLSMGTSVPANVNMLSILFKLTLPVFLLEHHLQIADKSFEHIDCRVERLLCEEIGIGYFRYVAEL